MQPLPFPWFVPARPDLFDVALAGVTGRPDGWRRVREGLAVATISGAAPILTRP